jgi:hypothetical protein
MGQKAWNNYGVCPWCTGHLKKSPTTDLLTCVGCGVRWYLRADGKFGLWDDSHKHEVKKP